MAGAELVLVSHLHSDHFDSKAQDLLPKSIPLACQAGDEVGIAAMGFQNVYPVHEVFKWGPISIHRIPGRHGDGDVLEEMGPSSGFLFRASGEPGVFWAGDTVLSKEVREVLLRERPEVVVTHSSGAVWGSQGVKIIMDEVQTVEVAMMLPHSIVVATHMDSLDHGTVTREDLRAYARDRGITADRLIIPRDGEVVSICRP